MKKLCSVLMAAAILLSCAFPAAAAQVPTIITPLENTTQAFVTLYISDDGEVEITLMCSFVSSTISATAVTYLEQKVDGSWERVEFGNVENEEIYSTTEKYINICYTTNVSVRGEYRVTSNITVSGPVESDRITLQKTCTY